MSFQDTNRRTVRSGGVVFRTFEQGPFWRIASGAVCLETTNGLGRHLVQLALPGDLLGVETLFDQPMRFQARALVATALDRINLPAPAERTWLMREALETQQERSLHMTAMRTGAVANRLGHFLQLMGHSGVPGEPYPCARSEQIRRSLPPCAIWPRW